MNIEQFTQILDQCLAETKETLGAKGLEYARTDRLSNFKQIAHLNGVTNEKALMLLVSKHIVALSDFVSDIDNGQVRDIAQWSEKIGDIRAYMILLKAMIIERLEGI